MMLGSQFVSLVQETISIIDHYDIFFICTKTETLHNAKRENR